MPLSVKPIGFRVLVERTTRKFGKLLLDNPQGQNLTRFTVVAVGEPGTMMNGEKCEIPCKVGDDVMFASGKECGPPWLYGGRDLIIVEADAILAVFSGEIDGTPPPKLVTAKTLVPN